MTLDLYYSNNYHRLYYREYNKTTYLCSCGLYISKAYRHAHQRSQKHKRLLEKVEIPKPNLLVKFD